MEETIDLKRREFIRMGLIGTAGLVAAPALMTSCSGDKLKDVEVPEILPRAVDGRPLKAGLVGCGGRGTGAALNFLNAGDGLSLVAMGDLFPDQLEMSRGKLKAAGVEVPDDKCFTGFDAFKKVIDSDIDIVLLCTPPVFRPEHFAYAVEKGRHVFAEKPCAVDSVGAKRMLATSKIASSKGLCVISGTVRRSEKDCIETYKRVAGGMIGDIVSAHVLRFGRNGWVRKRRPEWSDMEYMIRNWQNFCWTSGDFILEQFIHEIDQMTWFTGDKHPVLAQATGGRLRRVTGDLHDFISVEYTYENGLRAHCTSRQIGGCDNTKNIMVYGTKGYTNCTDTIFDLQGNVLWKYPYPEKDAADQSMAVPNPFVEEHIRLVTAIRRSEHLNDMEKHVQSVLICLMGRQSAYTGKFVTWDEVIASQEKLAPDVIEFGPVPGFKEEWPKMGVEYNI